MMKAKFGIFFICLLLVLLPVMAVAGSAGNTWNDSFNKAKKTLEKQVYFDHRITFYCGCPFGADKKVLPCDKYTPKMDGKRARRVEWEHVVPAAHFGQSFKE